MKPKAVEAKSPEQILLKAVRAIDSEFALFVVSQNDTPQSTSALTIAAALVSYALSFGDSCIHLDTLDAARLWPTREESDRPVLPVNRQQWQDELRASTVVGDGSAPSLLVLRENRLYLYRYFYYEQIIVKNLTRRVKTVHSAPLDTTSGSFAQHLFATDTDFSAYEGDLQLAGALLPLFSDFSVISGGPGTGKTTSLTKVLALMLHENPTLSISLAAPTGKASQRMKEAIIGSTTALFAEKRITQELQEILLTLSPQTIHRLLKPRRDSPSFRHNAQNPLTCDILVVDEASMIDLPLLAKLLDATPEHCKVILLGDQYQLASVEAGAVLGDICSALGNNQFNKEFVELHRALTTPQNVVSESDTLGAVVQLKRSFRFDPTSGVGKISAHINSLTTQEEAENVVTELLDTKSEVQLVERTTLAEKMALSHDLFKAESADEALSYLTAGIILTLKNEGPLGQKQINEEIVAYRKRRGEKYPQNMPIMITENSYGSLSFSNGDMGVVRKEDDQWFAFFSSEEGVQKYPLLLLPSWQPAYAITIHKSQGSEYHTLLILIGAQHSSLLTRELIYTAITRVKPLKKEQAGVVRIEGSSEALLKGILQQVTRHSGIVDELEL